MIQSKTLLRYRTAVNAAFHHSPTELESLLAKIPEGATLDWNQLGMCGCDQEDPEILKVVFQYAPEGYPNMLGTMARRAVIGRNHRTMAYLLAQITKDGVIGGVVGGMWLELARIAENNGDMAMLDIIFDNAPVSIFSP